MIYSEEVNRMSEADNDETMPGSVDGTVLQDQVQECDDIIIDIRNNYRQEESEITDDDPVEVAYDLYKEVRKFSVRGFEERFEASALYDALKAFLRKIGEECGYEQKMFYEKNGRRQDATAIDNSLRWFKLYSGVLLEKQPEITYEWSARYFKKEYREPMLSHAQTIEPLRDGPDPKFVSFVVPLWFTLEDVLRLWRKISDMSNEKRTFREQVLRGETTPDGLYESYRYGFVQDLMHNTEEDRHDTDAGFITDFQYGENGDRVLFEVDQIDFFPSVGDVVKYRVNQSRSNRVRNTVSLFE